MSLKPVLGQYGHYIVASLLSQSLGTILLVASIADREFIYGGGGAFQYCLGGTCSAINSNCEITFSGYTVALPHCGMFQSFRAFLILGVIFSGVTTLLLATLVYQRLTKIRVYQMLLLTLYSATALWLVISIASLGSWASATDTTGNWGDSWGLEISALVFTTIGGTAFALECVRGAKKTVPSTTEPTTEGEPVAYAHPPAFTVAAAPVAITAC